MSGDYDWITDLDLDPDNIETLGFTGGAMSGDGYGPNQEEDDPYALPADGSMDWESLPSGTNTDKEDHSLQLDVADGGEDRQDYTQPDKTSIDKIIDFGKGIGGALGDAITKDPMKAVQFLGSSLGAWYQGDEAKKAADLANRNRTQEQIDKENRLNKSVTANVTPKGIVQSALQRTNGSNVWNPDGTMNKG